MSALELFQFEGAEVRVVVIDDEPWFVLADLARVLDLASTSRLAARLDEGVRQTHTLPTAGGAQEMTVVSEAGMYEVVIRSDKPEAVAFRRWITSEVLPSIRKSGSYAVAAPTGSELLALAVLEAQSMIAAKDAHIAEIEAKVAEDAPKVEYVDRHVAAGDDVVLLRDMAAHYGIGEGDLRQRLSERRFIYRKLIGQRWSGKQGRIVDEYEWRAYAEHSHEFSLRAQHNAPRHHNGQVRQTLYVLAASMPRIAARIGLMAAEISK
ncbi:hypothetical protein EG850_11170 [Gulosibacter macacae]|uniref:Bro-N domain-containing protein n=1 Tax=Gulosibacter macacae TaxID=2488791 RepID=A0A3P3VWV5_9MICO|nr:phage antirepressor [Gulosibacter macacae]RRJ85939.1 hypothetical protein EG850_11170 [Gulosibacter macacae]